MIIISKQPTKEDYDRLHKELENNPKKYQELLKKLREKRISMSKLQHITSRNPNPKNTKRPK